MSLKAVPFTLGCVLAWFVLLPVVVIGGGFALLLYAILAELAAFISNGVASRSHRHLSSQQ
jgi:hypothetical protein